MQVGGISFDRHGDRLFTPGPRSSGRSMAIPPRKARGRRGEGQHARGEAWNHGPLMSQEIRTDKDPMSTAHLARLFRGFAPLAVTILLTSACAPTHRADSIMVRPTAQTTRESGRSRPAETSTSARRLAWPLDEGYISSEFGNQRAGHRHRGIDIRIAPGASIRAAAAGRITFSGRMRGYGNVIIVDHGDGLETRYAHNRRNRVHKGDSVEVGSTIADVGSTGNASAPHLHFEVREDGHAKDPLSFLPASSISSWR